MQQTGGAHKTPVTQGVSGVRMADSHDHSDLATISSVADFVVNLSISARSQLIYGTDHPLARRMGAQLMARLKRALALRSPMTVRFTREAVFCGEHCLERSHPIYRRLSERMWKLGIASLTFSSGVDEGELGRCLQMLNRALQEQRRGVDVKQLVDEAGLSSIQVELLRDLVSFTDEEEVAAVSRREQERFWDEFMRRLAGLGSVGKDIAAADPDELPVRVADDYAEAVIDYMKEMQRFRQQERMLEESDVGNRIRDILDDLSPDLQHQIMASVVTSPKASPGVLRRLIDNTAPENLVCALQRVNASGRRVPATAFRTLSLLCARGLEPARRLEATLAQAPAPPPRVAELLDTLLLEDDAALQYMTPEYAAAVASVERAAQRAASRPEPAGKRVDLSAPDGERHFLWVAEGLLDEADRAQLLALGRELERSFLEFLEAEVSDGCRLTMEVARSVRSAAGAAEERPYVWETETVLGPLAERLAFGSREDAAATMALLGEIGAPAIPKLVEVLVVSSSLAARRRTLELLEEMGREVVPHILPLLGEDQPWYVRRNAVLLLRRRREPAGAEAALHLWPHAAPKVRMEIIRYLLDIGHAEGEALLRESLREGDEEEVLGAARQALRSVNPVAVKAVVDHIDELMPQRTGSALHHGLLEALACSPDPTAADYLASSGWDRVGGLPARRDRRRRPGDDLGTEGR